MRRMKMMLTFTLLMIPGALSFSVTGYTGGAVTITCQYDIGYSTNKKYFCRHSKDLTQKCSDLIKTNITNRWFKSGIFSLYDDTTASVFNVTITDLNERDSDTYYCAVDRSLMDIYTEVILNVREDDCCEKIISLSVPSGGSVNVSCKYPQSHRTDVKFLCRSSGADICAHVRQTRDRDHDVLFITNVTDHRSEEYWCALQTEDHRYKIFITRVHITVTEMLVGQISSSPPSSSSSSTSFPTLETSMFTEIQQTDITLSSAGKTTVSGVFIIVISVVLFLLLVGVPLLLLTIRHTHGSDLSFINTVEFNACDKADLHSDANTDIRTTVVYSLHQ